MIKRKQVVLRLLILLSFILSVFTYSTAWSADEGSDWALDTQDNCMTAPNGSLNPDREGHSQLDTDGEGIENLCDKDPNNDATVNNFVIASFNDSVLHDKAWFQNQPDGFVGFWVKPKTDSGNNTLKLAVGKGLNGTNALEVESSTIAMGLPGFWLFKSVNKNGSVRRIGTDDAYFLPATHPANRLEFWVKFDTGYKLNAAASQPPFWPNHMNFVVGTYNVDPLLNSVASPQIESNNWHFYHHIYLRHDKVNNGWIHVVLNQQPQHQRSVKDGSPANPSIQTGYKYYQLLTRIYFDAFPYRSPSEIPLPYSMLIDDIKLSYVPEDPDVTIALQGAIQGSSITISKTSITTFNVTAVNNKPYQVCGKFDLTAPRYFTPSITGISPQQSQCIPANGSLNFNISFKPFTKKPSGLLAHVGITFVNDNLINSTSTEKNMSASDENIEKRVFTKSGPHDAEVSYFTFNIVIQ